MKALSLLKQWITRFEIPGSSQDSQGGERGEGGSQRGGQGGGNGGRGPFRNNMILILISTMVMLLLVSYFMREVNGATSREITYSEFIAMLEKGEIQSVKIKSDSIEIIPGNAQPVAAPYFYGGGGITD